MGWASLWCVCEGGGEGMASLCVCVGREGGWAEIFHYNGGGGEGGGWLGCAGGGGGGGRGGGGSGGGGGRCFSIEWYRIEGEGNNKYVDNNR